MEVENGCIWKAANNSCREPLSTSTMEEGYLSCSSHPCWVPTIWSHSNICTYPAIVTRTIHTCLVGDRYQPSLATGASLGMYCSPNGIWGFMSRILTGLLVTGKMGSNLKFRNFDEFWPCFWIEEISIFYRHHMDIWHVFYRSRP